MYKIYNLLDKYLYPYSWRHSNNPLINYLKRRLSIVIPAECKSLQKLKPALPKWITIDPSSVCNLKCPLCPTGTGTINLKPGMMSLDKFKFYLKKMPSLEGLFLYNWGESFLNPQLLEMIRHAKKNNLFVGIDSNLSLGFTDEKIKAIINSGLDELRVSLDGATSVSYNAYRKGGNFDLVYGNLKKLRQAQKDLHSPTPQITWKFLINKYNEAEIEEAKKMAAQLDVKIFFDKIGLGNDVIDVDIVPGRSLLERMEEWLPRQKELQRNDYQGEKAKDINCPMLFSQIFLHSDGNVLPCCFAASQSSFMGNLNNDSLEKIWTSEKYMYARSLFFPGLKVKKVPVICEKCPLFSHRA